MITECEIPHRTQRDTLTIGEAAERLGITVELARKAARAGDLPAIKFRGRFLILRKQFDRMLALEGAADATALDADS